MLKQIVLASVLTSLSYADGKAAGVDRDARRGRGDTRQLRHTRVDDSRVGSGGAPRTLGREDLTPKTKARQDAMRDESADEHEWDRIGRDEPRVR